MYMAFYATILLSFVTLSGLAMAGCMKKSNASNACTVSGTLTLNLLYNGYTNWIATSR